MSALFTKILQISFLLLLPLLFVFPEQTAAQDCRYWHKIVGVKHIKTAPQVDESDPRQMIEGIACLLQLEDDYSKGTYSGATHFAVSQELPQATVNVTALYYITRLFEQSASYANGVVLVGEDGRWNSKSTIKTAYMSYRKWFEVVRKIGIEEARRRKLDPLEGMNVRWY